ncbi:LysR substrate-binding domain-containing protein [Bradyrhizobium sp. CB2312]|uniref:LysR substrate-binding domain-containing protein n=1 Tax=Bradyrhizobium sp. CB2312 TaxID=3039155 RepID=UPI0024B27E9E|nr:LysR substrate-binding domain-containing protein [Bradyrhizobium sp. CB2312]WFU71209.1 LysR substrate-binding domain-containing protein [Bradyrhizobium sp. CB2312]
MHMPRRFLPSTALLAAFEATARMSSITLAARELSLTQSAVSRQIKLLEGLLEVELFARERQSIRLTAAGEAYAREIREALRKISTASFNVRANPKGGTLNLAILPTFGTRWLAPRLPLFFAQHPGITINLATRLTYFDFRTDALDAAIHFGPRDWPGAEMALLRSEEVVPTCSSKLKNQYDFCAAGDLKKAPLLGISTRPGAWDQWFSAQNIVGGSGQMMYFDQFATAAQAAMAGVGVALLPTFLIQDELANGKLVRALDLPIESAERYYLVWPTERSSHPPLIAFRDWVLAESAADR